MNRRESLRAAGAAGALLLAGRRDALGIAPAEGDWPLRSSDAFEVESKAVGDTFAVGVWQPDPAFLGARGQPTDQPLSLVYVLDGSWALNVAAVICNLQLVDLVKPGFPPLLLVGVDYPEGRPNARSRDYTMADSVPEPMSTQLAASPATAPGGADRFLRFMEEELDPLIRSRYRVKSGPAGVLGDSFGGTFTFYAFLRQTALFDRYWLGSPGLFTTGTDYVGRLERVMAGRLAHETRMFLSFGELEASGGVALYEDMGRNFRRLVEVLERSGNDRLTHRSRIYPGHTHTTVLAPAINDALLYLYGPHLPGG